MPDEPEELAADADGPALLNVLELDSVAGDVAAVEDADSWFVLPAEVVPADGPIVLELPDGALLC